VLNKLNISPLKQKLIVYIALAVVTFAVYWQVNQYGFVNFDDDMFMSHKTVISGPESRRMDFIGHSAQDILTYGTL
jgi:hypothetical protein